MRESGFYWGRDGEDWIVAEFNSKYNTWQLTGIDIYFEEYEFDEIDEKKIERY